MQVVYNIESIYENFHEQYPYFHRKFNSHPCCVIDYLRYQTYKEIQTDSTSKIVFSFHLDNFSFTEKYDEWQGVLTINCVFDFEKYAGLPNDVQKKEMLATFIVRELHGLFHFKSWNFTPITDAAGKLQELNFAVGGELRQHWYNTSKNYKAKLSCHYELESIIFEVQLYKGRSKEILCIRDFAKFTPSYACITEFIKTVSWPTPTIFSARIPGFARKNFSVDFSDVISF